MKGRNGIEVSGNIVTGSSSAIPIDLSKEAAMVVVGCRGLGAIGRRLLGSVSWGVWSTMRIVRWPSSTTRTH